MEQEYRARAVAHRRGRYAAGNRFGHQVASSFELEIREPLARSGFGLEWSFLDACSVAVWVSSRAIRSLPGQPMRGRRMRYANES